MTLAPLLAAPAVVQFHVLTATAALFTGAAVLFMRKGTARHRLIGQLAAACMAITAITSYWIHPRAGGYSWIHILSVVMLVSLTIAIVARRRGDLQSHKYWMLGALGGLTVAGLFTLMPGRLIHAVVFGP